MTSRRPKGFYLIDKSWSRDKSFAYYQGFKLKVMWPVVKSVLIVSLYFLLANWLEPLASGLVSFLSIVLYPRIIALVVPNTVAVPAMDQQCFLSNTKSHCNYVNCSLQDNDCADAAREKFTMLIKKHPKLRYKVKEIAGDYYYEEMSVEETIQKAIIGPKSKDHLLHS